MGKRGPKPKENISTEWSANLAYAVGLIASDGCLYNDGRHMALISKDMEQIENFKKCLGIKPMPRKVISGYKNGWAYRLQFGSVLFYEFLVSTGLTPAKSKTIGALNIPDEYFFDFFRGSFDGDGCFYSYWDSRWKSSHMFYLGISSGSKVHIDWLQSKILSLINVKGHIDGPSKKDCYQIKYAKRESLEIIKKMYYSHDAVSLSRKRLKINKALEVERVQQSKY